MFNFLFRGLFLFSRFVSRFINRFTSRCFISRWFFVFFLRSHLRLHGRVHELFALVVQSVHEQMFFTQKRQKRPPVNGKRVAPFCDVARMRSNRLQKERVHLSILFCA